MRDEWTDRLSEYVDGELPEEPRRELEARLEENAELRAVLAQIRAVKARAAELHDSLPERDLWPGIEASIQISRERPSPSREARRTYVAAGRKFAFSLPQLAAAAVVLLLLGSGAAWLASGLSRGGVPVMASRSAPRTPAWLTAEGDGGVAAYEAAIHDLQGRLEAGRGTLDTTTVRIIENSLATIDRAISQARAALEADPANAYLNQHLAEAMTRKLRLLERASVLAGT